MASQLSSQLSSQASQDTDDGLAAALNGVALSASQNEDFDEEEDNFVSSQTEQIQETIASEEKDEFVMKCELDDSAAADPTRKARGRYPPTIHRTLPRLPYTSPRVHIAAAAGRSPPPPPTMILSDRRPPRGTQMALVLTESLRLQSQDALAGHQSRRFIVGFVKRDIATLVSKAWRTARNQQTTRVKCHYNITDAAVLALAKHCRNLTTIYLTGCDNITDAAVIALAKHCPNLTDIYLTGCNITDAAVLALAEHCPNLTGIGLSECDNITEKATAALRKSHEGITIHD